MQKFKVGDNVRLTERFIKYLQKCRIGILEEQYPTFGVIKGIHYDNLKFPIGYRVSLTPNLDVVAFSDDMVLITPIPQEEVRDDFFRFQVAPYALFDVLNALRNTRDHRRYLDFGVTKEDNDLVVWVREKYISQESESKDCCTPLKVNNCSNEGAVEKSLEEEL